MAEIREAINKLKDEERNLLLGELFATMSASYENSPEFRAAIDEAIADCEAGRIHTIDEVRAMSEQWISKSSSRTER